MEPLESYYTILEAIPQGCSAVGSRDNIIWGVIVLVGPPLAAYLRDPHTQIDWVLIKNSLLLYAFAFSIYILAHLCRTPRKLDAEREMREQELSTLVAERDQTIAALAKPKRTPAEQYDYDRAKKALQQFGQKAIIALRHLRTHETLIFGTFNPILPADISRDDTVCVPV